MIDLHLLNVTSPFIFFWRVEFSAWRRSSSPSTGLDAGLGGGLDAEAAPPSFFRHWFSCSSCSICVHSWKNKCYNVKITIMIWSFYSVWTTHKHSDSPWRVQPSVCCSVVWNLPPDCGVSPEASHSHSAKHPPPTHREITHKIIHSE